jgi:PA domain
MTQYVYYANSDLCNFNVDTRGGYPERDTDKNGKMKQWQSPYILLVDRGGCTFVQKVRNAQRAGAAGVVIADITCLCYDDECTANNGGACETIEPIMADDGSGADVSIPSFLMLKRDADVIKAELTSNRPVQIEIAWSLPSSPNDSVDYELWTVPADVYSREFLMNFKAVAEALGTRAYFTPHMYIYDGVRVGCRGNDGQNYCFHLCTNHGRYCANDAVHERDHVTSGADIVQESLRRFCIWKLYGAQDGVGSVWWDYVVEFMDRCSSADNFTNNDCIMDVYKRANVNGKRIQRCMQLSGGLQNDSANAFLDMEIAAQAQRGVVIVPTVFVNSAVVSRALTVSNVFTAICARYNQETFPRICSKCANCYNVVNCIKKGRCHMNEVEEGSEGGVLSYTLTHTFFSSLLFAICVFGGLHAWYYKKGTVFLKSTG